jgi:hypothetical protein
VRYLFIRQYPHGGWPLILSRYYSLTRSQPNFVDRAGTIHDEIAAMSAGRRNGYS